MPYNPPEYLLEHWTAAELALRYEGWSTDSSF